VQDAKEQVRSFIVESFMMGAVDEIPDDTSFLDRGLLDSTGVLELVGFLEERFGIVVVDDEIVPENLDSLNAIAAYVQRKLGS
jgi:acyl carrier protein